MCKCDVFRCEEQWQQTNISEMHLATRVFGQKVQELHEDTESQVVGTHAKPKFQSQKCSKLG